jgi:hypothetical protein
MEILESCQNALESLRDSQSKEKAFSTRENENSSSYLIIEYTAARFEKNKKCTKWIECIRLQRENRHSF